MLHYVGQGEVGVFGSLREAASEVVEAAGKPGVVLAQAIDAQSDQFFREHFGEGRSYSFEVRARGDEVDVSMNGETRGGACWRERPVASTSRNHFSMPPGFVPSPSWSRMRLRQASRKAGSSLRARIAASLMGMRLW